MCEDEKACEMLKTKLIIYDDVMCVAKHILYIVRSILVDVKK